MPSLTVTKSRLAYIDWMRGLACILMFQTHCYDSWLGGPARQSRFFMYSQLGGTFPAPLFLFLAGISFALVTDKLRQKSLPPGQIARTTIRRGAEVFAFGLLLRLQEYVIAWGWAPKSDLLRVDILNTIGLSMMLMGVMCWLVLSFSKYMLGQPGEYVRGEPPKPAMSEVVGTAAPGKTVWGQASSAVRRGEARKHLAGSSKARLALILAAVKTALLISLLTPLLWTRWRPDWLPWPLESYINGVHNLGTPQAWLFPIFPWAGFAFAGLAVGFILQSDWTRSRQAPVFFSCGAAGLLLIAFSRWLDAWPRQIYPVYDYWHTSPEFFLIRVGMLMGILTASYAWCRWGAAQWGFSPLIQLGQASLLVYWVHIEFVYGRVSVLQKRAQTIGTATAGLVVITVAMIALAYIRTHAKGWMKKTDPGATTTHVGTGAFVRPAAQ